MTCVRSHFQRIRKIISCLLTELSVDPVLVTAGDREADVVKWTASKVGVVDLLGLGQR